MVAAGGNFMWKTPQEAYDLIENMTQHHFQWDAEVYYDTTTGASAHYSETTSALSAQIEFIFDLSINPFPLADRSDSHHEEFADELAHITSPPEYDRFYFDIKPDLGELTILIEENISKDSTKELTSPKLNDFPLLLSDCDFTFSEEFSEIDLLVLFPSGNKDMIFDPGIFIIKRVQSKRFHIFPLDDFPTISFVSNSLFLTDPSEIDTFLSFPSRNEDKVFDPAQVSGRASFYGLGCSFLQDSLRS
ncbi:hypothetical protein Tco_0545173 [Tanacetum coccineum]